MGAGQGCWEAGPGKHPTLLAPELTHSEEEERVGEQTAGTEALRLERSAKRNKRHRQG